MVHNSPTLEYSWNFLRIFQNVLFAALMQTFPAKNKPFCKFFLLLLQSLANFENVKIAENVL